MKITSIQVLIRRHAADVVTVFTDHPDPIVTGKEKLSLTFKATQNTGVQYVRENFSIEPEVVKEPNSTLNF